MTRELDVYFRETKAGVLGRLDDGLLTFTYNSKYLLDQRSRAISFSMPLQEESFGDQVVRPFFSGLLPDEGARQRLAGALGLSAGNAFGLLEVIGGECAGALSLYTTGTAPETSGRSQAEILTPGRLDEILSRLRTRPLLGGDEGIRLSLAGAQDKLAVIVDGDSIALAKDGRPTTHILKPVTVLRVGANVRQFKAGDEVYGRPRDHRAGTFAEMIAVDAADLALKPVNLSMEQAASIPLVGLTAWQALVEVGKVKPGQEVFIQAGSGDVGTFAIQLAKHLGAIVATTTSAANVELVKSLGADLVIDYKTQDFEQVLSGYDLVLNSQDAKTLAKSLNVLKPGGRLISISGPPDVPFAKSLRLNLFLRFVMRMLSRGVLKKAKSRGVEYSFLFMRAEGQQLAQIAKLIDAGAIRPVVDKVFPFAQTPDALAYVETGRAKGKVVVKIANQGCRQDCKL